MSIPTSKFDEYNMDNVEVGTIGDDFTIYAREDGAYLVQAMHDGCVIGTELVFENWKSVLSAFRFYSDDEWFIDPDSLPDEHDESEVG